MDWYAFGGYYYKKNGGGTQYYTASIVSAKNWDKTSDTTLYAKWVSLIGTAYQGGIVFYIFQPDDLAYFPGETHGLIAATADQSELIQWYNGSYTETCATATALGTGQANTTTIVNSQGGRSYAAKLCDDYTKTDTGTGVEYDDWFLPSKDELNILYQNRTAVGGFSVAFYWSSSELNSSSAYCQTFSNGNQYYRSKDNELRVRPVRAF
jgi:hypothetical protein